MIFLKNKDQNIKIQRNTVLNLLKDLNTDDFKFKFCEYLKSLVSSEDKKSKVYQIANRNLNDFLDIKNYLKLKLEVELLKQLMMDKKQLLIFNSFSTVINIKSLLNEIIKNEVNFNAYDKDDNKNLFESLDFIIRRQNSEDKKIIEFIMLYEI